MRRFLFTLVFGFAVGMPHTFLSPAQDQKEPSLQGKTVREWTEILSTSKKLKDREEAAVALGELGEKARSAVPALIIALKDVNLRVRMRVVEALGKIGPVAKAAIPHLEARMKEATKDKTRTEITLALESIRGTTVTWTLQRLYDFGIQVKEPGEALLAQLQLPKEQGLVLEKIEIGSPAEQCGLKLYDVLLEINNKPVPNTVAGLLKLLETVKTEKPINIVVLRNAAFETLKGVKLPKWLPMSDEEVIVEKASYVIQVQGGSFNGRYEHGKNKIIVEGKIDNGRPVTTGVSVFFGSVKEKYSSINDVPQKYRKYARKLIPSGLFPRRRFQ